MWINGRVVQWLERHSYKVEVDGPIPSTPTNIFISPEQIGAATFVAVKWRSMVRSHLPARLAEALAKRAGRQVHAHRVDFFKILYYINNIVGRLAQLVERLVDVEKVTGSSPVSPTLKNLSAKRRIYFFMPREALAEWGKSTLLFSLTFLTRGKQKFIRPKLKGTVKAVPFGFYFSTRWRGTNVIPEPIPNILVND